MHARFGMGLVGIVVGALTLGGCSMGNFSNPVLSISSATVTDNGASLGIEIDNPSDSALMLEGIDYTLTYGPLPVASGTYAEAVELPAGSSTSLRLVVAFDSPPLDPTAREIQIEGTMRFDDSTNSGNMQLEGASFDSTARVRKR